MSDARWSDIEAMVASAARHFSGAVAIYQKLTATEDRYLAEMAFLHAMQSGQTSLESVLLRILELFAEEAPHGRTPACGSDRARRAATQRSTADFGQ
jgi:hypothetical protein